MSMTTRPISGRRRRALLSGTGGPLHLLRLWLAGLLRRPRGWWAFAHRREVYRDLLAADDRLLQDIAISWRDLDVTALEPRRNTRADRTFGALPPV